MKTEGVATTIARGTTVLFVMEIVIFVCGMATKILLANWLTPGDIGVITLVTAWVGIATIAFLFGIPGSITKFISEYVARGIDPGPMFSTAMKIILTTAVIGSAITFLLSEFVAVSVFHAPEAVLPFQLSAIIVFFTMLYRLVGYGIMGFQKMDSYVLTESLNVVSLLAFTASFLYLGYGLMGAVWAMVFSVILATAAGYMIVARLVKIDISPGLDRGVTGKLITFGVPFYSSVVIEMLLGWTDTLLLGFLTDKEQVGYYGVALWLMGIVIMLTRPINTAVFPAFSAIFARGDRDSLSKVLSYSTKYSVYVLFPAAVGVFILADTIIALFFGEEFLPAVVALRILTIAAVFSSLRAMGTKFIAATGRPRVIMKFIIIAVTIDIVLNYFFIQWFGIAGAASATTIAYAVFMLLCYYDITREIKLQLGYLVTSAVACAIMAAVLVGFMSVGQLPAVELYGLQITPYARLLVAILASVIVYGVALWVLKGFDKTDKEMMGGIMRKITRR